MHISKAKSLLVRNTCLTHLCLVFAVTPLAFGKRLPQNRQCPHLLGPSFSASSRLNALKGGSWSVMTHAKDVAWLTERRPGKQSLHTRLGVGTASLLFLTHQRWTVIGYLYGYNGCMVVTRVSLVYNRAEQRKHGGNRARLLQKRPQRNRRARFMAQWPQVQDCTCTTQFPSVCVSSVFALQHFPLVVSWNKNEIWIVQAIAIKQPYFICLLFGRLLIFVLLSCSIVLSFFVSK